MIDPITHAIELPAWLPPLVKEQAEIAYRKAAASGSATQSDAVQCVTTDPRMEGVWQYLQKRRRDKYRRYAYPVHDPASTDDWPKNVPTDWLDDDDRTRFGTRAEWLQQLGFAAIYDRMVTLALSLPAPATPGFVEQFYRQEAADQRAQAKIWSSKIDELIEDQAGFEVKREEIVSHLLAAADAIEAIANQSRAQLERAVPKAAIMLIARKMDELFGPSEARQPMYGQTATIASIVLGREITADEVRGTIRNGPWKITHRLRL